MSVRAWIRAARPLAHANIAPPLLLGQALAVAQGAALDWLSFALAHGFGVLDHLVIVFTNDVADREGDALHSAPTIFSGGSRVLQEKLLRPAQLVGAALAAAAALVALSGVGVWLGRPLLPLFAVAALGLLAAYSLPPLRLSYRGHGEILQGLGVGLVLPLLGFYLQAGSLAEAPWALFAPLVVFGFASNILTALPDVEADRAAEKRSWPVRRGEAKARRDAIVLLLVGLVLARQLAPPLPAWWLVLPLLFVALALVALRDGSPRGRVRFVALAAASATALQLGLAVALFSRGLG
jgi:1,4-dihydroxy-2-naphthoate octaprenyltransferase